MFFNTAVPTAAVDARSLLLRRSLRAYCRSNRQSVITETAPLSDAATPVAVLESLSAFARPKHAPLVLFDGLINAPEAHLGRNVLVCVGTLQAELQSFAQRNAVDTKASPLWWKNLLRNYERVILLDNAHLAQSVGFAPWTKLHLAADFPVTLGPQRDASRIVIVNHDPDAAEQVLELHDLLSQHCEVSVLGPRSVVSGELEQTLEAAIHLHYGYSSDRPTCALTPLESMINGFYTIVLSPPQISEPSKRQPISDLEPSKPVAASLGQVIVAKPNRPSILPQMLQEIRNRRYGLVVEDTAEMLEGVDRFLTRLAMFNRGKLAINPELQRYDRMNEDHIATMHGHFIAQVPS